MSASKSFRSAWSTSKDSESRGVAWYISIESFGVFHLARSIISDLSLRIIHEYMIHACSTSINWRPDQIMFRAALLCSRASPVPLSIDVFGDLLSSRFLLGIFSLQTSPYVSFRDVTPYGRKGSGGVPRVCVGVDRSSQIRRHSFQVSGVVAGP